MKIRARIIFEPRDVWVGVFVKGWHWEGWERIHTTYICFVPMLPVVLYVHVGSPKKPGRWH